MTDRDPRDKVWEERARSRADKAYSDLTYKPKRTIAKWVALVVLAAIVISGVGFVCGIFGDAKDVGNGYRKEGKRVISVENVKEQNTRIIEDWESMNAAADNACAVGEAQARGADDPTLVEDPTVAYRATYNRIRVDYNRRFANLYEAQAVSDVPIIPSNLRSYPKVAPTFREKLAEVC